VTRALILRIAVLVLIVVGLGVGAAYALGLSRTSRHRLAQLDKYCLGQISDLRIQVEFIRTDAPKSHVTTEHVEDYRHVVDTWLHYRICASGETATAFERDMNKCTFKIGCVIADPRDLSTCLPAFMCAADAFEKLADAMSNSN
jgi:hypothetical protein